MYLDKLNLWNTPYLQVLQCICACDIFIFLFTLYIGKSLFTDIFICKNRLDEKDTLNNTDLF